MISPAPNPPADHVPAHHPHRLARRWFFVAILLAAAGVFVALLAYMRQMEARATRGVADPLLTGPASNLAQTARVAESVRALQLVTLRITTRVTAESADSSWRGDASAIVEAPVRLHYGTDLSSLDDRAISFSPLRNQCVVRVPPPSRIATEVMGANEETEVRVGWLRFKSQAGEKHLGQARVQLYERAQDLRLLPLDAQSVREQTRSQVAKLIRGIVGDEIDVLVRFDDEAPGLTFADPPQ